MGHPPAARGHRVRTRPERRHRAARRAGRQNAHRAASSSSSSHRSTAAPRTRCWPSSRRASDPSATRPAAPRGPLPADPRRPRARAPRDRPRAAEAAAARRAENRQRDDRARARGARCRRPAARAGDRPDAWTGDLVLVGRRHLRSNNSWMHNLPMLVSGPTQCTLHVHPDDANRHELVDGGRPRSARARGRSMRRSRSPTRSCPESSASPTAGVMTDGRPVLALPPSTQARTATSSPTSCCSTRSGNAVLNGIPVELAPGRGSRPGLAPSTGARTRRSRRSHTPRPRRPRARSPR